jgi:hypothetical protein
MAQTILERYPDTLAFMRDTAAPLASRVLAGLFA